MSEHPAVSTAWKSMTMWRGIKGTDTKSFKYMIKQVILKVQFLKTRSRGNRKKKPTKKDNNKSQTKY